MKHVVMLLLAVVLCTCMIACGKDEQSSQTGGQANQSQGKPRTGDDATGDSSRIHVPPLPREAPRPVRQAAKPEEIRIKTKPPKKNKVRTVDKMDAGAQDEQ
ncbi:MAG: hypothetical protein K8S55_12240 [Phycisphaerae bacterium]|nr:hypothetical protein [Phycisphaerae bacterium]